VVERISKIVKFRQISKKTKKHVDIVCWIWYIGIAFKKAEMIFENWAKCQFKS
jgi:hypothetical protein